MSLANNFSSLNFPHFSFVPSAVSAESQGKGELLPCWASLLWLSVCTASFQLGTAEDWLLIPLGVFRKSAPVIAPLVSSIILYKIVFPLLFSFTPLRGGACTSVPGPSAALPYTWVSWAWRSSWCAQNYGWRTQQWKINVDKQSIWDESEFKLRLMCRSGHVASFLQV